MAKKLSTNQKTAICTLIVALAALIGNSVYQTISILNLEKQQNQITVNLEEIKAKVGSFENFIAGDLNVTGNVMLGNHKYEWWNGSRWIEMVV